MIILTGSWEWSLTDYRWTRNWNAISTRKHFFLILTCPNINAIVSLLATKTQASAPAHYDSALHVVKYLAATASRGLYCAFDSFKPFHAFVHFPNHSSLQAYCNTNCGPMDLSVPKHNVTSPEQWINALHSISRWFIMNAGAPVSLGAVSDTKTQPKAPAKLKSTI